MVSGQPPIFWTSSLCECHFFGKPMWLAQLKSARCDLRVNDAALDSKIVRSGTFE
jgi:hypothetical protein